MRKQRKKIGIGEHKNDSSIPMIVFNSSLTQNIIYQDYNNGDVSINANARDYYAFNIEKPGYVILGATPIGSYENVIDYIITLSHSSYTATLVRKNNYGAVVTCRQAIRVIYKKL